MGRSDYLKQRHHAFYVRVQIPKALWATAGKREFVKALGTRDRREAELRKHVYVAEFKRRIAQLEAHGADPHQEKFAAALSFKDAMQRGAGRYIHFGEGPDERESLDEFWLGEALEQANEIAEEHDEETADRFMRVVRGEATFLRDVYPPWLDETQPKPKQRDAHSKVMRSYIEWAGPGITVEETDRKKAGAYLSHLTSARALAPKTVAHYRSSLSTLWVWLEEKGLATLTNPWANHKSLRATVRTRRKELSDVQLTSLLSGSYDTRRYRQVLADLLRLALVTGCRLEELCKLKKTDVVKREDGYWLVIVEGKTLAAEREVPVHASVSRIVERRRGDAQGEYLLGDLTPGAYGRRSHHVSKAYGRYRKQVGVSAGGQDFHALRGTFTGMMEGAGVPVSTIQLLIGHSRRSSMGVTAVYTQGTRVDLREAIDMLDYPEGVMRLLSAPNEPERT